jgi:hypothetical protein
MSENENVGVVIGKGCPICGLLAPGVGCAHFQPTVPAVDPTMRIGLGGLQLDSSQPTIVLISPRTGLPLCGADYIEAIMAKKEIL